MIMKRFLLLIPITAAFFTACTTNDPSQQIQGRWKCTELLINGTDILGIDSSTTNLENRYNLNYTGEIVSDAGTEYFTYSITENTLTHYTANDTVVHMVDTLSSSRLRMHVTIDTVTYDGAYTKL